MLLLLGLQILESYACHLNDLTQISTEGTET